MALFHFGSSTLTEGFRKATQAGSLQYEGRIGTIVDKTGSPEGDRDLAADRVQFDDGRRQFPGSELEDVLVR